METETKEDVGELVDVEWTYLGRRTLIGDKIGAAWLNHHGVESLFADPPKGGVVGSVYAVRATADAKQMVTKSAKFVRSGGLDDDALVQHRLKDRTAYLEAEARKTARREQRENGNFGALTLDDVRRKMLTAGGFRRGALIAAVIAYIEGAST